ncbi:MAG: DUF2076 domain-containing protein [Rhizobiales bacterium]|nr:DUF2076 domain-containing protein [Hyphomicrobiales bacterium]
MTPTEREMVADLFDRLAKLEKTERDPQAERAIADGLAHAPNAIYPLVQTVLVQDQALKNADARIRELEAALGEAPREGGFLDNMRNTMFGRRDEPRGSVPTVRAGVAPATAGVQSPPERSSGTGSFLGTAAAAAVGVIGGALLLDSIRSMATGRQAALNDQDSAGGRSPWQSDASNSDLAREAGIDDIGRGNRQSLLGNNDDAPIELADNDIDDGPEFDGGIDFGGGDVA